MVTPSYTTKDLENLLKSVQGFRVEKDISQFRYVIYARKSNESEERQIRSLGDQIIECEELAKRKGLKLISEKPIKESSSAKEPDIRPKFRQMLDDFQQGSYEGIIAWHPDRLARNMKDAGEIIDLLDKDIIKDLQFVSFTFENNPAGKMLLGISFVLSKQYSDKLSEDVQRGIKRSIQEGRYLSKAKHGYYRDRNMMLRPDGKNFNILKSAWQMRLEGKTQTVIADFMNNVGYCRTEGYGVVKHKPFKMIKQELSEIFKDSYYCGVLVYGERKPPIIVDLTEIYDFVPMISVDEYLKVNRLSDITKALQSKIRGLKRGVKADLLRGKVICGYCNNPMSSGITIKQNKRGKTLYYFYRCDQGCKVKNRSGKEVQFHFKPRIILDFVYRFLEEHKFASREVYNHYLNEIKKVRIE